MGAGKTTLATALAVELGRPLRDSDVDIAASQGRISAEIASQDGAPALHALELAHLTGALAGEPAVIAAAGWTIEVPEARKALAPAFVVFIDVDAAVLAARFDSGAHRPVYGEAIDVLTAQSERRRPLFLATADLVIGTGDVAAQVTAVVDAIATRAGG